MAIFHIVGTDTNCGKTYSCVQIMRYLTTKRQIIVGLKPLSSGSINTELGFINEDVAQLLAASNCKLTPAKINPFHLTRAIAPHIAADLDGRSLCVKDIHTTLSHNINTITANHILIEGIGGIMVPLNADETYLDVLGAIPYPLILVVGMKLGCLNHALLSATALQARGIKLSGWIANQIDPNMSNYHENCNYLQQQLGAPLIATTPFQQGLQPTNFFEELFPCL